MLTVPAMLFLLGAILLTVEVFVPGFGVFGVSGIVCLGISALYLGQTYGAAAVLLVFALLALLIFVIYKFLKHNKVCGKLILQECVSSQAFDEESLLSLMGKEGVTVTPLKPGGKADFNGRIVEVFSNGEFISKGRRVRVVLVSGRDVTVQEVKKQEKTLESE